MSLPKGNDPLTITFAEAVELILAKRKAEAERIIKKFDEDSELQILNGRFGPYISYIGSNYKLPKSVVPAELTLEQSLEIVSQQQNRETAPAKGRRKYTRKK